MAMISELKALFDEWIGNWRDLMDFEVVPVRTSAEAIKVMSPQ